MDFRKKCFKQKTEMKVMILKKFSEHKFFVVIMLAVNVIVFREDKKETELCLKGKNILIFDHSRKTICLCRRQFVVDVAKKE